MCLSGEELNTLESIIYAPTHTHTHPHTHTHTHTQYESRCDSGEALRSSAEPTPLSPSMLGVPQTRWEDTTTNYQTAR